MNPTVGRIVHFNNKSGDTSYIEAAMIVAVHGPECVNLVVWNSSGTSRAETSKMLGTDAGTWAWPART